MSSQYDGNMLYQFLVQTPESALRKMLINGAFTQVHFNMAIKILRAGSEDQFCQHFYQGDFPKAKFNAQEIALKETFWSAFTQCLNQNGLLSPTQKIAA